MECMLDDVVTPTGQSVNQSAVYVKLVHLKRIAIAEENAAIY